MSSGAGAPWAGADDVRRGADELAGRLPDPLTPLARLAFNLRWSWTPGGPELFEAVDPEGFARSEGNPVRFLRRVSGPTLTRAADDRALVERAAALESDVRGELERPSTIAGVPADRPIAFACAEFAVHRSLPIYAGGLGVLAGDILKEASDRGLPLVGLGLLYREGCYHQRLDPSGLQVEHWDEVDPSVLPIALVTDAGAPLQVDVPVGGRAVALRIWRADVGRVPLFLLDADVPGNAAEDRAITSRLYVGDPTTRLAQYVVLGIGGIRALEALGIEPSVVHLNEGHAVFAGTELTLRALRAGAGFDDAFREARSRVVFTTHTPVPAGNETYEVGQVRAVLGEIAGDEETADALLASGRTGSGADRPFDLTAFGIRASRSTNAVSRRHGQVARRMWRPLFPDRPEDEVPIDHVTNAVHLPTWIAPPMRALLDRHLGEGWTDRTEDPSTWARLAEIPDEHVWSVRRMQRSALVTFAAERTRTGAGLDAEALTLGFARRLAAYKRVDLLARDPERLSRLLLGPPQVQLVVSGKAHPSDDEGKAMLRSILEVAAGTGAPIVVLEDYDLEVAARMVAGCDVWVNLPRAPLEASGTSGMKAALNGGLNLSVLDGWWEEAFDGGNGWGIRSEPAEPEEQDARDAAALYDLLEREVSPMFHARGGDGIPRRWIDRVRASMRTVGPRFTAGRMLNEYLAKVY